MSVPLEVRSKHGYPPPGYTPPVFLFAVRRSFWDGCICGTWICLRYEANENDYHYNTFYAPFLNS